MSRLSTIALTSCFLFGALGDAPESYGQETPLICGDCRASDSVEKAFAATPGVVFLGRVTAIDQIDLGEGVGVNAVKFEVLEQFKEATERVFVATLCGYPFEVGQDYIVWAERDYAFSFRNEHNQGELAYTIATCSQTARTAPAKSASGKEDLNYLRSLPECGSQPCRLSDPSTG